MRPRGDDRETLIKSLFDLGREFKSKSIQALGEVADILQKMIIEDYGRDGGAQSRGRGYKRFRDTGSNSAEAGGPGGAKTGKGVNDAPDGSEEADEGRH